MNNLNANIPNNDFDKGRDVKNTSKGIIRLDKDADIGLHKLADDLKRLSHHPKLKTKFPFIDAVKIVLLVGIIAVTIKVLIYIWSW